MSAGDSKPPAIGPAPEAFRLAETLDLAREGVDRTQFFYSFSGAMVVDGALPALSAHLDRDALEISPPLRIADPSFRPTPQLTFDNVRRFFNVAIPTPFPLQVGTFPGPNSPEGATANCWFGPSTVLPDDAPTLPADTLLVTLWGPGSASQREKIEQMVLEPLLDWLRVLTRQWWIGRSIEGVSGPLHFVALLDKAGRNVGSPTPTARFTSAGPAMKPVTPAIWIDAAEKGFGGERPPAARSLEMDSNFALASHEFRTGVILAACAIEAARDALLAARNLKPAQLKTSKTDLLKHLSTGFALAFGRNLADENPALFHTVAAFWRARGEAAHGKAVKWRLNGAEIAIEAVKHSILSDGLADALAWIDGVRAEPGPLG